MKHRFLVPAESIQGDAVTFSTEQWHQLHAVLRLRVGDQVRVFDGVEPCDRVVDLVGAGSGRVTGRLPQAAEPRTRLMVYPALLQRDKFEPVLQKLTEVGAAAIVPLLTARGVVREAPDERRSIRWLAILREATEQCGRGIVPELHAAVPFPQAIARATTEGKTLIAYEGERKLTLRDALAAATHRGPPTAPTRQEALPSDSVAIAAQVSATPADGAAVAAEESATPVIERADGAVSVFVGPEGGFAPEEVACAVTAGARLFTLGPRIMRSETASPVVAALVLYELGDLSSADDDEQQP